VIAAETDAEVQSAAAQQIERGRLAGHLDGSAAGERRHHRPEADPLGRRRDRGERDLGVADRQHRRAPEDLVPHEEPVPAGLLGLGGQVGDDAGIGELVEERKKQTGVHRPVRPSAPVWSRIAPATISQSAGSTP
jgi:hypothetical protein